MITLHLSLYMPGSQLGLGPLAVYLSLSVVFQSLQLKTPPNYVVSGHKSQRTSPYVELGRPAGENAPVVLGL
jgi:hypothetical protein